MLEFTSGWSTAYLDQLFNIELATGMIGPSSGAGAFQRWYHENIVLFKVPNWTNEIVNTLYANLNVQYIKEWQFSPNPFSVHFALSPKATIGTKDVYLEPEAILFLGRRNYIENSIAYNRLGSVEKEIYIAFKASYRFVGYNALLEGELPQGISSPLVEPKRGVFFFGFDFLHRAGQNDYKFGYRWNTQETFKANEHQYLILSYGRSF